MPDFTKRSFEKELLDAENIPFRDIEITLNELHFVNTWLGGYNATRYGLKKLLSGHKGKIKIADVGCGGGHHLIEIAKWCRARNLEVELVGIDMKAECIQYAMEKTKAYDNIRYITSDYRLVDEQFDVINSCLFTHHLNDDQLSGYIAWSRKNSTIGVVVNDLHRHFLAYYSIKYLTKWFSHSHLVKNDACLSVLRSFKAKEWKRFDPQSEVHWNWAFRYTTLLRK
ncbi:methyltransferase domain-containing protein [Portibacter lacus]|uniref:Methyltransferase domain-containing protein n=1 Tax=Portibacter lacus TaxID=1099794 RepID=A0AA37SYH6_9BACT|nr:methyltransferase domain-containing protein [Portibacter lacus]GLR19983.1 hypothetical protein GCM10007940_45990 [Portibacter lacus]